MECKNLSHSCPRSPTTVRGLLSCQAQLFQRGVSDSFTCTPLSLWMPHSPSVSPKLSAQRHSPMMGFSDGIKMSRPAAVTHANCIVYRFYHWEQPAVCFVWCLPPFHIFFCPDVITICGTAGSLVNISESHLLICLLLSVLILLQVYRHSYMASYSIYNIHTR